MDLLKLLIFSLRRSSFNFKLLKIIQKYTLSSSREELTKGFAPVSTGIPGGSQRQGGLLLPERGVRCDQKPPHKAIIQ
jgi:hypothetical protein